MDALSEDLAVFMPVAQKAFHDGFQTAVGMIEDMKIYSLDSLTEYLKEPMPVAQEAYMSLLEEKARRIDAEV